MKATQLEDVKVVPERLRHASAKITMDVYAQAVTSGKSELTGWGMRNLVTDANNVRWNNAALRSDNGRQITHFDAHNNVLGFLRWDNRGNVVLTVVNLSDNQWDQAVYGINVGGNGALTRCNACLRVSERIE